MSYTVGGFDNLSSRTAFNTIKDRFSASGTVIIPHDLKICAAKYGSPNLREPVKIRSASTSYASNGNNEVIWQLNNDGIYDFRRGYITFDVAIAKTGGTYARLASGSWSIWYRMRTLLGFELENIQEYNRLFSMLWNAENDVRQSGNYGMLFGLGTATDRNAAGAVVQHYAMPLLSGWLGTDPLPLNMFNVVSELRLTMGDATTFVETDGTAPVVTITNLLLHCERVSAASPYYDFVKSAVLTGGLNLSFPTWQYYSQSLATGSQNLNSIIINHKSASMKSIVMVWTAQQTVNTTTTNDKFITWPNLMNKSQWKVFGRFFPEEPIVFADPFTAEAYFIYLNWLTDEWHLSGNLPGTPPPIAAVDFAQGNQFLSILDVNGYPYDKDVINALGTENSTVQLQHDVYLTNALTQPFRADFFVDYQRQIYVNSTGTAVVSY